MCTVSSLTGGSNPSLLFIIVYALFIGCVFSLPTQYIFTCYRKVKNIRNIIICMYNWLLIEIKTVVELFIVMSSTFLAKSYLVVTWHGHEEREQKT